MTEKKPKCESCDDSGMVIFGVHGKPCPKCDAGKKQPDHPDNKKDKSGKKEEPFYMKVPEEKKGG